MKAATALTLVAANAASAFVVTGGPTALPAVSRSCPLCMTAAQTEFANGLIGGEGPEPGSKNFDPLGFAERSPDRVNFYREAELKHGRIAQLAIVGLIVQENCRLPGDIFQGVSVLEAHDAMVERGPMVQLLIWIGLFETLTFPLILNMNDTDREPGDFSLDPLGFCKDPEKKKALQIAELKHCRLGMLAFSGAITQAALTGHGYPFLY